MFQSILHHLNQHTVDHPNQLALSFHSNLSIQQLTFSELTQKAKNLASILQTYKSYDEDRVAILLPSSIEYIVSFLACLYAGMIAVPIYPPRHNRKASRVFSIIEDAKPKVILTTNTQKHLFSQSHILAIDTLEYPIECSEYQPITINPNQIAFLQYTSGSTSSPKGVMVSHQNIISNIHTICAPFPKPNQWARAMWLPPFHDMGLIGGILATLYQGAALYWMTPESFLSEPLKWLELLSTYQIPISVSPPFGLELCVQQHSLVNALNLDLSHLKYIHTGSEPIQEDVLIKFIQKFSIYGLSSDVLYPCYGLAEATLMVSGKPYQQTPSSLTLSMQEFQKQMIQPQNRRFHQEAKNITVMNCGRWDEHHDVKIVHPQTLEPQNELTIGEIWVSGPSVALGYWEKPELTQGLFAQKLSGSEGCFIRTGDLGFIHQNELYVTGRIKDMIILRGQNFYAHDIENFLEKKFSTIQPMGCIALGIQNPEEQLILLIELRRSALKNTDFTKLSLQIKNALTQYLSISPQHIVFFKPLNLPKTSSGKRQRLLARELYLKKELSFIAEWLPSTEKINFTEDLYQWLQQHLEKPIEGNIVHQPLGKLGLSSLALMELAQKLKRDVPSLNENHVNIEDYSLHDIEQQILKTPTVKTKTLNINTPQEIPWLHQIKPYLFNVNEGIANHYTQIQETTYINFSSYNYLGLSGEPFIKQAIVEATERYGSSVSASRLVSGEKPLHRFLEQAIAQLLGAEDAVVLPSGYGTNIAILTHFFNHQDLILYDELAHNSIIQGAKFSQATCQHYPHQHTDFIREYLTQHREQYRKVLLVTEGIFSMDGDIANIPDLIAIKHQFKTHLMIDEAHSIGVLGTRGGGVREYFDLNSEDVDFWMGTLSKSFASCGGYLAGNQAIIDEFKYFAHGFVYSAGISPMNTAAAYAAIQLMQQQPERLKCLKDNHEFFLKQLKSLEWHTGESAHTPIIPLIVKKDEQAIALSEHLKKHQIIAHPIIYPAVPMNQARVRLFINALHTKSQLSQTLQALTLFQTTLVL